MVGALNKDSKQARFVVSCPSSVNVINLRKRCDIRGSGFPAAIKRLQL
jgi:hypothetical protein